MSASLAGSSSLFRCRSLRIRSREFVSQVWSFAGGAPLGLRRAREDQDVAGMAQALNSLAGRRSVCSGPPSSFSLFRYLCCGLLREPTGRRHYVPAPRKPAKRFSDLAVLFAALCQPGQPRPSARLVAISRLLPCTWPTGCQTMLDTVSWASRCTFCCERGMGRGV